MFGWNTTLREVLKVSFILPILFVHCDPFLLHCCCFRTILKGFFSFLEWFWPIWNCSNGGNAMLLYSPTWQCGTVTKKQMKPTRSEGSAIQEALLSLWTGFDWPQWGYHKGRFHLSELRHLLLFIPQRNIGGGALFLLPKSNLKISLQSSSAVAQTQ